MSIAEYKEVTQWWRKALAERDAALAGVRELEAECDAALARVAELEAALLGIQQRLPRSSGWDDLQVREYCEDVCRAALAKGKT